MGPQAVTADAFLFPKGICPQLGLLLSKKEKKKTYVPRRCQIWLAIHPPDSEQR